jgi:hypothetical protein
MTVLCARGNSITCWQHSIKPKKVKPKFWATAGKQPQSHAGFPPEKIFGGWTIAARTDRGMYGELPPVFSSKFWGWMIRIHPQAKFFWDGIHSLPHSRNPRPADMASKHWAVFLSFLLVVDWDN